MSKIDETRVSLLRNGYAPTPCRGKKPVLDNWPNIRATNVDIGNWPAAYPDAPNTGVLAAEAPGLDLDVKHPEAAEAAEEMVREWFDGGGEILLRFGEAPKRLIPFRTARPFAKILVCLKAPDGNLHRIELLGAGQQYIVNGIHPDTRRPYSWHADRAPWNVPHDRLPEIDEGDARELIKLLAEMLKERFGFEVAQPNGKGTAAGDSQRAAGERDEPVDIDTELLSIVDGASANAAQCRIIPSQLRKGVHPDDVLKDVAGATITMATRRGLDWTLPRELAPVRRRILSAYNNLLLKDYESTAGVIPDWLPGEFHEAWIARLQRGCRQFYFGFRRDRFYVRDRPDVGAAGDETSAGGDERKAGGRSRGQSAGHNPGSGPGADGKAAEPAWPTPYSGRAAPQIPRRAFAMGQHYIIGATSVTASAGGVGKSTLSLLDGVSLRIGRNLLTGEALEKCRRVWIWNAEDDIDEMERRLIGICIHYGINRADLVDWLFLDSGYDLPLDLAHGNGKGPVMQDELIELIAERVTRRGIEVVSLDPLVALHSMAEGDNPGHAKLIRTISTKVAKPCNCAVDINAHTRKPGVGQDTMTIDDVRGAGSIIYSARSGRILHGMTLAEAQKYGIEADDRFSYYRLERAKANMAKRGTICWVRMIEVPIPNSPDGSYGDTVAVPTLWTPPDAMEGITETVANAIAGEIAKGQYRRDPRSGASWAGKLVGLRCGIDTSTKSGAARAKTILETLIKKGVLAVDIQYDKNRNAREFVVPGVFRAPR